MDLQSANADVIITNGHPKHIQDQNQDQHSQESVLSLPASASVSVLTSACTVCGQKSDKKCAACNQVYYCSSDHQKQDWKNHKNSCGPFRIEQNTVDDKLGKQWVANRNLEAGEILLDENVCFYGPFSADGNSYPPRIPPSLICIVCGLCSYTRKKCFCSKCGWPVCGIECENDKVHVENECELFTLSHGSRSYDRIKDDCPASALLISRLISTIRGSKLKSTNAKLFQELLKLQYTCDPESSSDFQYVHSNHPQYIRMFLSKLLSAKFLLPAEIYDRIQRVVLINSFIFCDQQNQNQSEPHFVAFMDNNNYRGQDTVLTPFIKNGKKLEPKIKNEVEIQLRYKHLMYIKASRLNHSCYPNCTYSIGPSPLFKIRIRASVSIKKDEPLTIYYPFSPYNLQHEMETSVRRDHLYMFRGIQCKCPRCSDPTELSTFISALKCTSLSCQKTCKENKEECGYCVPYDPLTIPQGFNNYSFKCLKCGNIQTLPNQEDNSEDNINNCNGVKDYAALMTMLTTRSWNKLSDILKKLNSFREKYSRRIYHSNWIFMLEATLNFVRVLEDQIYECSDNIQVLERHLEWVQFGLDYFDGVLPGVNLKRAQLLKHRAAVLRVKLLEHSSSMTAKQLKDNYQQFLHASKEALKFYQNDFPLPGKSVNFHAQVIHLRIMQIEYELGSKIESLVE